jgi:1-phosphatidylinositol-4-phosphate 5-kinase
MGSESSASSAPKGVSFALDPPASGSPKGVSFGDDPSPRDQDKNDMSAAVAAFSNYTNKCNFTVDGKHEPNVVLKDNDLKYKFKLHGSTAREVALQLEKDANFLLSIGVMDYSLLVGVHNNEFVIRGEPDNTQCQEVEPRNPSASNAYASRPETDLAYDDYDEESALLENIPAARRLEASRVIGADSYLFGIIDFQQKWTFQKKMERFLKIQFKGADPYGLSAIEPTVYKDRFVQHMRDVLDVQDFFCD